MPEIDADCRNVSVAEGTVDELAEEARLPDAGVPQEEKLEEVVVLHVAATRKMRKNFSCLFEIQSHFRIESLNHTRSSDGMCFITVT